MLDKKLVESACKKILLKAVMESETLKKKLSVEEHTKLCEKVLELKYHEALPLLFGGDPLKVNEREEMRDYESKFKKGIKYAAAGAVGSYATRKAVGKATGRRLAGIGSTIAHPIAKTKWGIAGTALGAGAYYLYRKLSDPCRAKAAMAPSPQKKAEVKHQCQAEAAKRVISQLNKQLSQCDGTNNPTKCKAKIQKEIITWKKRLQQELINLAKVKRSAA